MNVCIRVQKVATFFGKVGKVSVEAVSVSSEDDAIVVLDEWFQNYWVPEVGNVLWIAGLTTWGVFEDRVIQFLFPPWRGVGIAKQPTPAGDSAFSRALELFAGIGGWGEASLNVLGVDDFSPLILIRNHVNCWV